jgi:hypothetical protein
MRVFGSRESMGTIQALADVLSSAAVVRITDTQHSGAAEHKWLGLHVVVWHI